MNKTRPLNTGCFSKKAESKNAGDLSGILHPTIFYRRYSSKAASAN